MRVSKQVNTHDFVPLLARNRGNMVWRIVHGRGHSCAATIRARQRALMSSASGGASRPLVQFTVMETLSGVRITLLIVFVQIMIRSSFVLRLDIGVGPRWWLVDGSAK